MDVVLLVCRNYKPAGQNPYELFFFDSVLCLMYAVV